MRLDRFISQGAGVSRSSARLLIRQGRVQVDAEKQTSPAAVVSAASQVWLDGDRVLLPGPTYLMMHKPAGLLSATRDGRSATVMELLPPALSARLHLVGRLDKDTTGLLLLSDDGAWTHRLTSPRHACAKVYRVGLSTPLPDEAEATLAAGIRLRGEQRPARPAILQRLDPTTVRLTVTEGRYHLVRRLVAAMGSGVLTLHRERIGGLALDPGLEPSQWRHLSEAECQAPFLPWLSAAETAGRMDALPTAGDLGHN